MFKSPASVLTPISEPLGEIHDAWTAFAADPAARLLIWVADDAETALLDTFVSNECDADVASTPDLFLQLRAPFSGAGHGHRLASELAQHYDELARSPRGVDGPLWQPPLASDSTDDVERWLQLVASFRAHHLPPHAGAKLVMWLDPSVVSSHDAYALWLQDATLAAPDEVRLMLVAASSSPACGLAEAYPRQVHARAINCACPLALEPPAHGRGSA